MELMKTCSAIELMTYSIAFIDLQINYSHMHFIEPEPRFQYNKQSSLSVLYTQTHFTRFTD